LKGIAVQYYVNSNRINSLTNLYFNNTDIDFNYIQKPVDITILPNSGLMSKLIVLNDFNSNHFNDYSIVIDGYNYETTTGCSLAINRSILTVITKKYKLSKHCTLFQANYSRLKEHCFV